MPSWSPPDNQFVTSASLSVTVHGGRNTRIVRTPLSGGTHPPGPPCIVFFLRTLGGTAPARRGNHPRRQPPGGDQEAGVPHHPVLRADGQAFHVPAAHQALPGGWLVEAAVGAQGLHGARQLGGSGHVTAGQAARREYVGGGGQAIPRRQQV